MNDKIHIKTPGCFITSVQTKCTTGTVFSVLFTNNYMSQAFVKEQEEQWLHDVSPTLNALIFYLTRENNGVRVYEQKNFIDSKLGKEVHIMSNGGSYAIDDEGKWYIL